jgi:oligoendopeptidase F
MRSLLLAALLAAAAFALAAPLKDNAAWDEDAITLGYQIDTFDKCRGRLAEKPRFGSCTQLWEDAYRRWTRMHAYVTARLEKDAGDLQAFDRAQRTKALGARLDEAAAFYQPEVRKLGRAKVSELIASGKLLAKYRAPLDPIFRPNVPAVVLHDCARDR